MKNIFKIHPITYLIIFSVLITGFFNYFLIISMILLLHDLGHIIMILIFKYKIENIEILPFGSIINTNITPNAPSIKIFLISIAGVLIQGILFFIMPLFLNNISYSIFIQYNTYILIFNLLPIIPLDGSKIISSILESFMSYKLQMKWLSYISFLTLIILLITINYYALNAYLVLGFLFYKTYEMIANHTYLFNHFLLDRHLHKHDFKHIKHIRHIHKIHKNKYNFINNKNENKVLDSYFDY